MYLRAVAVLAAPAVITRTRICQRRSIDHTQRQIACVLTGGSSSSGGGCHCSNHSCCCTHNQSVREGLSITSSDRLRMYLRAVAVLAAPAVITRTRICQRRAIDHTQRHIACVLTGGSSSSGGGCRCSLRLRLNHRAHKLSKVSHRHRISLQLC